MAPAGHVMDKPAPLRGLRDIGEVLDMLTPAQQEAFQGAVNGQVGYLIRSCLSGVSGAELDMWGEALDMPREGADDEEYRAAMIEAYRPAGGA